MADERKPLLPGWDLALARLVLAGVFGVAAITKIADPANFAFAIESFDIIQHLPGLGGGAVEAGSSSGGDLVAGASRSQAVIGWLAFLMPWVEAACALALLLGFWSRAAAMVLFALLLGFAGALLSVVLRNMQIDCQCFGRLDFFGDGSVTYKSVLRNVVFMAVAAPVMVRGGGLLSIDVFWAGRAVKTQDPDGS